MLKETNWHTRTQACTHARTQCHAHTHAHNVMHTCTHTMSCTHAHMHAHNVMHTRTQACTHARTHTMSCTHAYMNSQWVWSSEVCHAPSHPQRRRDHKKLIEVSFQCPKHSTASALGYHTKLCKASENSTGR